MGMLDGLFSNDPQSQGILALASGLLSNRGNFGQNVGASMQQGQGAYSSATAAQNQAQRLAAQDEWYRQRAAEQSSLAAKNAAAQDRADAAAQAQQDAQNGLISALTPPLGTDNPTMGPPQWSPDKGAIERAYAQLNPTAMLPMLLQRAGIGTASTQDAKQREIADYLAAPQAQKDAILDYLHGRKTTPQGAMPLYGLPPGFGSSAPSTGSAPGSMSGATTGADFLSTLPPQIAAQVQAIAEGRDKMPTVGTRNGLAAQQLRALVAQYDPTYSSARASTQKDFTSGQTSQNLRSINTAIGHLGSFADAAEALNNSDAPMYNKITNTIMTNLGKPQTGNFDVVKSAVADELTRTFKGVGSSEAEIQGWKQLFDSAKSPEQMRGAIAQAVDLLNSRINSNQDTWHKSMGPLAKDFPVLSPKAQSAVERLSLPNYINGTKTITPNAPGSDPQLDAILKKYQ